MPVSTKVRQDFIDAMLLLVKDGKPAGGRTVLDQKDHNLAVANAVGDYSRIKPRKVITDIDTDGSGNLSLSTVSSFDRSFSESLLIEYPISTAGEPNLIDSRFWRFYDTPSGFVVRLDAERPQGTANVRITSYAKHVVDSRAREEVEAAEAPDNVITTTIPEVDFEAVCFKGAAHLCQMLATYYTQTGEGGGFAGSDLSIVRSKGDMYATRKKELDALWQNAMGIGKETDDVAPASARSNWDSEGYGGNPYFNHQRRWR